MAAEPQQRTTQTADDYIRFVAAGENGKGEYRCSECSYGVTVYRTLPVCPMCSGRSWERAAWSPFTRASRLQ